VTSRSKAEQMRGGREMDREMGFHLESLATNRSSV
jgi:hypothetical protein